MNILAVNWLDLHNPQAGGAELHFFEIFRRLVAGGASVTLISSGWDGCDPRETIDGIDVHRIGNRHTFALRGRGAVKRELAARDYDIVVEDINKLPLYLAGVTHLPVYVIIPHLFGTTAFREVSFPVASVVWLAERAIPGRYRRAAFHAISDSTRDDLVARGIEAERIRVIYPGTDLVKYRVLTERERTAAPTFLYLGRLKRYKGVDLAIRALALVRRERPDCSLNIVGNGDDRPRLQRLARQLGLDDAVRFLGFVSEEEKVEQLNRCWALVFPSDKEGWGLTNVEAAACGTPSISSDSPGLRESVQDGTTGRLVPHGDVDALANAMLTMANDRDLVENWGRQGTMFASQLTWEDAAIQTRKHLEDTIGFSGG